MVETGILSQENCVTKKEYWRLKVGTLLRDRRKRFWMVDRWLKHGEKGILTTRVCLSRKTGEVRIAEINVSFPERQKRLPAWHEYDSTRTNGWALGAYHNSADRVGSLAEGSGLALGRRRDVLQLCSRAEGRG